MSRPYPAMVRCQKYVALWPGPKIAVTRSDQSPAVAGVVTATWPLPEEPTAGSPATPPDTSAQAAVQPAGATPLSATSSVVARVALPSTVPTIHGASDPSAPQVYDPSWPGAVPPTSPRNVATGGKAGFASGVATWVGDGSVLLSAAEGVASGVGAGLAAGGGLTAIADTLGMGAGLALPGEVDAPPVHPATTRTAASAVARPERSPNRMRIESSPLMAARSREP
jgi:hypothetical protein